MFLHHPGVFQKMIYLTAALCRGPWGCSFILALCLVSEAKAFVASRISVALQLQQRCGGNCAARLNPIGILANPRRCARQRLLRMDDEVSRPGIREELTTRDEYLATRFTKLSPSGYDLTSLTPHEAEEAASHLPAEVRAALLGGSAIEESTSTSFRDHREKGLYASAVGGLPLFTSGWKLESRAGDICPSFAQPCDEEHVIEQQDKIEGVICILCARSRLPLGTIVGDVTSPSGRRYLVNSWMLEFHPLGKPLPVRCQPENYWGSEGQYRAWNFAS